MRLLFLALSLFFLTTTSFSQEVGDTIINAKAPQLKVMVFYFHITDRCNTCYAIEKNVRKTIHDHFQAAVDSGFVGVTIVNCELPEHADLVKKFSAYGATLAITSYVNGIEKESKDITNMAFQKIHMPEIFSDELKKIISTYLAK